MQPSSQLVMRPSRQPTQQPSQQPTSKTSKSLHNNRLHNHRLNRNSKRTAIRHTTMRPPSQPSQQQTEQPTWTLTSTYYQPCVDNHKTISSAHGSIDQTTGTDNHHHIHLIVLPINHQYQNQPDVIHHTHRTTLQVVHRVDNQHSNLTVNSITAKHASFKRTHTRKTIQSSDTAANITPLTTFRTTIHAALYNP